LRSKRVSPASFEVDHEVAAGRQSFVLRGELDLVAAPTLEAMLRDAAERGFSALHLDLSGLSFMDSTGLHMVLLAQNLADTLEGELSIVPGTPRIQRLFQVSGLLDTLPWTDAAAASPGSGEL